MFLTKESLTISITQSCVYIRKVNNVLKVDTLELLLYLTNALCSNKSLMVQIVLQLVYLLLYTGYC